MSFGLNAQLRHVFSVVSGATPDSGNQEYWGGDILWITPEDLSSRDNYWLEDTRRKITRAGYESSGVTVVPSHSIALSKRAPIGHLALLGRPAGSNQGCFLLTPKHETDSRYFYYLLLSKTKHLQALGSGSTFMELGVDDLKSIRIPNPSLPQQRAIADYLDRETAHLDALVAAKQRLLDLLVEKRHTLISHTVTNGLDTLVSVREFSNLAEKGNSATITKKNINIQTPITSRGWWFGSMPEDWQSLPLKYLCEKNSLYGANIPSSAYESHGVRFIRTSDISDDGILYPEGVHTTRYLVEDYMLNDGDFLISRSGTIGRSLIYRKEMGPCAYAGYLIRYILKSNTSPHWLFYITKSEGFEQWLSSVVIEATIGNVNGEKYANMLLPLPPLAQQHAIVDYLDRETARLDELATKTRETIALLEERRAALIAAAVTGQIDMENAA